MEMCIDMFDQQPAAATEYTTSCPFCSTPYVFPLSIFLGCGTVGTMLPTNWTCPSCKAVYNPANPKEFAKRARAGKIEYRITLGEYTTIHVISAETRYADKRSNVEFGSWLEDYMRKELQRTHRMRNNWDEMEPVESGQFKEVNVEMVSDRPQLHLSNPDNLDNVELRSVRFLQ